MKSSTTRPVNSEGKRNKVLSVPLLRFKKNVTSLIIFIVPTTLIQIHNAVVACRQVFTGGGGDDDQHLRTSNYFHFYFILSFHYYHFQELYSWDAGNQLTYPVRYNEQGSTNSTEPPENALNPIVTGHEKWFDEEQQPGNKRQRV